MKFGLRDVQKSEQKKDDTFFKHIQHNDKSNYDKNDNITNLQEKLTVLGPQQGGLIGFSTNDKKDDVKIKKDTQEDSKKEIK